MWNCFQSLSYNILYIIGNKSQCIHSPHINTTIPTIAIIHNMTYFIRNFRCCIGHAGAHQTCVISFYLIVNIISMGIILPMTGFGRHNTIQNIVTRSLIGMPQHITCIGKSHSKRIDRSIQSQTVKYIHKGQIHINIIIQTRFIFIIPFNIPIRPIDRNIILYHCPRISELCRTTIRATYCLTSPSSFNLIK